MLEIRFIKRVTLVFALVAATSLDAISNLTKNDPYPIYTSVDPYALLTVYRRNRIKGYGEDGPKEQERFTFSLSPFGQSAKYGTNSNGITKVIIPGTLNTSTNIVSPEIIKYTQLGDLNGPWNIPGLFYCAEADAAPMCGATSSMTPDCCMRDSLITALDAAMVLPTQQSQQNLNELLVGTISAPAPYADIINPAFSDVTKQFGFFSVPIKYNKYGVRFEGEFYINCDLGLRIQTGVVDLKQTPTFIDMTCKAMGIACPVSSVCTDPEASGCTLAGSSYGPTSPNPACTNSAGCQFADTAQLIDVFGGTAKEIWIDRVMKQKELIARTIGCNIHRYETYAMEDTRFSLFWRKLYLVNKDKPGWPFFIMIPFLSADVIAPTGEKACPNRLFSLPTGNNGHTGYGFTTGFVIDFAETVECAFEASMTRWTPRTYCNVPVPTEDLQSGIFPFQAKLRVHPGTNWNFGFTLHAYHFIDRLSLYAQYMIVNHEPDCFNVLSTTTTVPKAIRIGKMRENSKWSSQMVNTGLTYDLSPNIEVGFMWQAPVKRVNAYRSTTIMTTLAFTF